MAQLDDIVHIDMIIKNTLPNVIGSPLGGGFGPDPLAYTDGMVLRLAAEDDNITRTGLDVSGWADTSESANTHNFSQGVGANQPQWDSVPLGSYSTVDLAANRFMTTAAHADFSVGTGSWLFWAIMRRPAFASNFTFLFSLTDSVTADNVRIGYNPGGLVRVFWGTDAQGYAFSTATLPDDAPFLLVAGVDSSANEVLYKIGSNALERKAITISGTGTSTVAARLHGDSATSTYDDDRVHLRELGFHNLGAAVAIATADIDAIATYAEQFGAAV